MAGASTRSLTRAQIAAVAAGNALEFYDFVTYSFFATQIGRALFPGSAAQSLLLSLATFGVGFLTRPLGGLVIGRFADRRGRKPAMILSFSMIGIAVAGLALTPPYAAIGMAAPVIAVLFRLLQGFALGGEVGPSLAYLVEGAPPGRAAIYLSIGIATQDFAVLIAGIVGFALASTLGEAALTAWGWRVAFLLGAAIVPLGLRMRRTLVETLSQEAPAVAPGESRRAFLVLAGAGVMVLGGATIANYTLEYLTTYAQNTLKMAVPAAFEATIVIGLLSVVFDLASGWLCARFGAKRVLIGPWIALILLAVPVFFVLNASPTAGTLLASTAALTTLHILGSTPAILLFVQALPTRVRAGATGFIYAVAIAIFGGSAQLVETALIRWTGNPAAPGWHMAAAVAVALTGALLIRERRESV